MVQDTVAAVRALPGVIILTVVAHIKLHAEVNQRLNNLRRGFNHYTHSLRVIFIMPRLHRVIKIALIIVDIL